MASTIGLVLAVPLATARAVAVATAARRSLRIFGDAVWLTNSSPGPMSGYVESAD